MEKNNWKGWLYLLPASVFLGLFLVYPLIDVLTYSFEEGYNFASQTYFGTGLYNYHYVLRDPYFLQALKNTLLLVLITVPLSTGLAMLISVGLSSIQKLRELYQTVYFLPYVTNTLAVGLVFMIFFKRTPYSDGLVNLVLSWFGAGPVDFIDGPYWAKMFVLCFYTVWVVLPFKILILTGALASGENPAASSSYPVPDEFDTSRRYEVTFWAKNDTNMAQVNIYKQAIADFEALYPNITVNLRLYTDYGKIYNDVITNIATDTTPNVCITYPDHIATYLTGEDTVVPLDDLFADEKYGLGGSEVRFDSPTQAEITHQFLSECAINGHYYAIPYMRSTEACYVNKTYVEKLGYTLPDVLTWDFVWEVSEAAMAKDSAGNFLLNGQKVLIPFIDKSTDNMMIQMLKQQGAGYSTSSGEVQLFNDTTGEILTTIAEHAASGAFNTFKLAGYPANFLNAGQCIFAIDSTAGATWMGADAPLIDIAEEKLIPFELAVLPVPQFDPEQPQMISQGPSVCVFNKSDPQEVLASWLFAQYLLTNNVQIAYSQTEGYIPVTSKAQESPAYQDYLSRCGEDNTTHYRAKIEAAQLLMRYTDCTFVTPVFNGSASLRNAAGQLIENVNKSVRRRQTVNAEYLSSLYSDVSSLYRLDQIQVSASGLGPLPGVSKALLIGLAVCWVGMGVYVLREKLNKRRKKD